MTDKVGIVLAAFQGAFKKSTARRFTAAEEVKKKKKSTQWFNSR